VLLASIAPGRAQNLEVDSAPKLIGTMTYAMPESAVDAEIDGEVLLVIAVDRTGKPTNASLATGPMWPCGEFPRDALLRLDSSLEEMALELQFTPATRNGKPVATTIGLTLTLKNAKLAPRVTIDPQTGKPKPSLIQGGVVNGKAVSLPKPQYPVAARANRVSGQVEVRVLIDEQGKIMRAGIRKGPAELQLASREAACGAQFSPTTLAGNPVKVSGVIVYNFVP